MGAGMGLDRRPVGSLADDEVEEALVAHARQRLDRLAMALVVVGRARHVRDRHAHEAVGDVADRREALHHLGARRGGRDRLEEGHVDRVVEQAGGRHARVEARHVLDRVAAVREHEVRLREGEFAQPRQRAEDVDVVDVDRVGRALEPLRHEAEAGQVDMVDHQRVEAPARHGAERARDRAGAAGEAEALVDEAALGEALLLVDRQREDLAAQRLERAHLVAAVGGDAAHALDVEADIEDPHRAHRKGVGVATTPPPPLEFRVVIAAPPPAGTG